jgi:hypothetical protein
MLCYVMSAVYTVVDCVVKSGSISYTSVTRVLQGCYKGVTRVLQKCGNNVTRV